MRIRGLNKIHPKVGGKAGRWMAGLMSCLVLFMAGVAAHSQRGGWGLHTALLWPEGAAVAAVLWTAMLSH